MTVSRPDPHTLARNQFTLFDRQSSAITISDADRRRLLLLSEQEWSAWERIRHGGPVPLQPQLPVMLRRLGAASHRLARLAERGSA